MINDQQKRLPNVAEEATESQEVISIVLCIEYTIYMYIIISMSTLTQARQFSKSNGDIIWRPTHASRHNK